MSTAYFRFHGRLNDFLIREQRGATVTVDFRGRQSIKHLAESLGVPHPEIGRVQVNGQEGSVNQITQDGDKVDLHPVRNGHLAEPRFVLDCHLGRLTAYLRMLGFDCLYQNDFEDQAMTELAVQEGRILLTRDRRLLMRKVIEHGYCLRSLDTFEQLTEVLSRFELTGLIQPFHRCIRCNHPLAPVEKEAVVDRLEPLTRKYFNQFHICPACEQIYWKGSHFDRMQETVRKIQEDQ
jgi:uncharacterized protein with PIN domain